MSITADVVVIGGGINGCCTAYSLAKSGVRKIILVEKGHIAGGPTGRSSGVVRQHCSHETLAAMARDSAEVWRNFSEIIGGDAGFVQCGVIMLAGEKDAEAVRNAVAMHQRIGIKESIFSREELADIEPALDTEDVACGSYEPEGGYADPALAANSFCEAARRKGVEVWERNPVTGLSVNSGKIQGMLTTKAEISTERVINVAGPWSKGIAHMAGVHLPIKASRHAVVILQRPPTWRNPTPTWGDLINGWYFKPEKSNTIMVGSIQDIEEEADIEDHAALASYEEIEAYGAAILKRFPVMGEGLATGGWAGLYDVTPDWLPVIDAIPEVDGFYCAAGFSGHGFKIAPAVGEIMAELVTSGQCRRYDIRLFSYVRFQEALSRRSAYTFGIIG